MGLFDKARNFLDFKTQIDLGKDYTLGYYRNVNKKNALLFKGKVVLNDVLSVSDNLKAQGETCQQDYLVIVTTDGYSLFNLNGQPVLFNDKPVVSIVAEGKQKPYEPVALRGKDNEIIFKIPGERKHFILYPDGHVSSLYTSIDKMDSFGNRKVTLENGKTSYIDKKGLQVTQQFISQSEPDQIGDTIVVDSNNNYYIMDRQHRLITKPFSKIKRLFNNYIGNNGIESDYFISRTGKRLSPSFVGTPEFFAGGNKLIQVDKPDKKDVEYQLLDRNFKTLYRDIPYCDVDHTHTGIVFAVIDNQPVVFGNMAEGIPVDGDVAKLIMSKLHGKRMSPHYIDRVIYSNTDIIPTIEAFEEVIDQNLAYTPHNPDLLDLKENLRNKFIELINRSTTTRIKKSEEAIKQLEQILHESDAIMKRKIKIRKNAGKFIKNTKGQSKNAATSSEK